MFPFELKNRGAGDYLKSVDICQCIEDLLGQAVAEVFVRGVGADVLERQDGDGARSGVRVVAPRGPPPYSSSDGDGCNKRQRDINAGLWPSALPRPGSGLPLAE